VSDNSGFYLNYVFTSPIFEENAFNATAQFMHHT
jgi:hypothetical protein